MFFAHMQFDTAYMHSFMAPNFSGAHMLGNSTWDAEAFTIKVADLAQNELSIAWLVLVFNTNISPSIATFYVDPV